MHELTSKYNVAGPRYTSYPTVPYWDLKNFSLRKWKSSLQKSFRESNKKEGISLYVHLPFCESLCTFCGCNKRITKNHQVEIPYIQSILNELQLYINLFDERPIVKQLHLGGGTPTFFSPEHLERLMDGIFSLTEKAEDAQISFEGHPNNTTKTHLDALAKKGFNSVSYGVQDYNLTVQKAIHRVQPFENVKAATVNARERGYASVGHDIIYGLPFQTEEDVQHTIDKTIELQPDRIAFYSYAHVPWIKGNGQRGYKEENLPTPQTKRKQYEEGKRRLLAAGYVEIGMDHFALPTDALYHARENGSLHRNFMGYAASKTQVMIGLGVSAIGDSWYSFAQNVKSLEEYQALVADGILPVFKGHSLTEEDLVIRKHILQLMCSFYTSWESKEAVFDEIPEVLIKLQEMEKDELIEMTSTSIRVTEKGKPFVRNVCLPFDLRLQRKRPETQLFSMTI
ncbi:oxygen-independent coproporphyrinogen III oxidase [Mesonia sp.]|uniref:oxygen-independent coproporphyrinogen III oxidase n=1 Tax=Mesonia sp. TaxID=1960830 RepID=UPI003F9B4D79